jgi:hypothetical protein
MPLKLFYFLQQDIKPTSMQTFQTWLYLILIFGLLITNLIFIAIYRREIKSLKSRNEELERTNNSSLSLASERAKDVDTFKNMYDPKYLKEYLQIHVKVEVEKAKALQQANLDNKQIKDLIDDLNETINFITWYMVAEKKYDREKRISFLHTFFEKSKNLIWAVSNQKIENLEKQNILTESKNPDV